MLCSTEDLEESWKTFLRLLKWYFHRRRVLPDDQPAPGCRQLASCLHQEFIFCI